MTDQSPTYHLIRIKTIARDTKSNLKAINTIMDTPSDLDSETLRKAVDITLHVDWAIDQLDLIKHRAELPRQPPSYGGNPDERRTQLLEMLAFGERADLYVSRIQGQLGVLMGIDRLVEARLRADAALEDVESICDIGKELCNREDGGV